MDVKNCTFSNLKLDKEIYRKYRNLCKNCYNKNRNDFDKTTTSYKQSKIENVNNNSNKNITLIIGFSNCG